MVPRNCLALYASLCVGVALVAAGCNRGPANVAAIAGEVKLDGTPIERGTIHFVPTDGVEGSEAGGEILNGRYRLSGKAGVAVGWNRVEISALRKTGKLLPMPFPAQNNKTFEEEVEAVADRYNIESTLRVEIQPGDNTQDFAVESN
jgi:hypothetical protein